MISADAINQPIRVNAVYSEGSTAVYSLRLEPPDARSLGLREGQVVNGLIASRPDGNVLVTRSNQQIVLPQNFAATQGAVRLTASAIGSGAFLLSLQPSERKPASNLSVDRVHRLLGRPLQSDALRQLVFAASTQNQNSSPVRFPRGFSLLTLGAMFPNATMIEAIKQSLLSSGLYNEANVLAGHGERINLKNLLLQIRRVQLSRGADVSQINQSLDEIESYQLDALGGQLTRTTSLNWLIPVLGDWPIEAQIEERDSSDSKASSDEKTGEWKVSLRISLAEDKHLDMTVVVKDQTLIRINLWTPVLELYQIALDKKEWLEQQFFNSGLQLEEINIFPSERKREQTLTYYGERETKGSSGIVVDV
ncbi:MAG: hypothetical protein CMQ40_05315 [Gammaproteobacteria bacterium]|nr:hypothetical protein [Gammaproteobacteria bacterium]